MAPSENPGGSHLISIQAAGKEVLDPKQKQDEAIRKNIGTV